MSTNKIISQIEAEQMGNASSQREMLYTAAKELEEMPVS